jgi:lipopolysaccharide transport system permease protein
VAPVDAAVAEHHEPSFDLEGEHGGLATLARDVWSSRQLIRVLARKDFFVRYRRASFGVVWAVALPLVQAAVLAIVLPRLVRFDTPGEYLPFVFGGTTVWTFFAASVSTGTSSIVDGQSVSTRVYFPRVILPVVAVLANVFGFVPALAVLVAIMVGSGDVGAHLAWLVPGTVAAVALATALCAVLASLQVYFRDVRYLVQAALLVLFYVTPVIYPLDAVGSLAPWIEVNPLTGVIELFRAGSVGADPGWGTSVAWTAAWTVALAVVAVVMHRRYDRVFVDLL